MPDPGLGPVPWLRGAGGERILLKEPESSPIWLSTIARALAHTARFGGHTTRFYSVAEHSLHVSYLLEESHGREAAIHGLLHDAHEAYVGDVPSPTKQVLGAKWANLEEAWKVRVAARFLLRWDRWASATKNADRVALATEMRKLMIVDDSRGVEGVEVDDYWDCLGGIDAEDAFLGRASQLGIQLD